MIRIAWGYAVAVVSTVFFGGTVAARSALRIRVFRNFAERATARWAATVLWGSRVDVSMDHPERLGTVRSQVLVSNHQSWFDVFALAAALPVPFSFVGKKELSRIPFLGHAWEKVGHVAIDRGDRQSALESLTSVDRQIRDGGRTIIMFPEGTRSPTGQLGRFKKGAFVMAIKAQVPVIPVSVSGSRRVMRKGSWKIRPGRVTIRVGHPIDTAGLTLKDRDRLMHEVREAVAALKDGSAARARSEAGEPESGPGTSSPGFEMATETNVACRPS